MKKQLFLSVLLMSVLLSFGQSNFRKNSFDKATFKSTIETFGNVQNKSYFDNPQKLDSIIKSSWDDSNSQWIDFAKVEYLYDILGYTVARTDFYKSEGQWFVSTKDEWSYDGNGNNVEYIVYSAGEFGGLEPSYKKESTYDMSNNIELSLRYYWSSDDNQWMLTGKDEYSYDAAGNNTLVLGYQYEGGAWNISYKIENTFDVENRLLIHVFYQAGEGGGALSEYYRDVFTYDYDDNILTYIQYWDGSNSPHSKTEITYINNVASSSSTYLWNGTDWDIDSKKEISYDAEGNPILQKLSFWDGASWILNESYEHSYDTSSLLSEIVTPVPQSFVPHFEYPDVSNYIVNKPLSSIDHNYDLDELSMGTYYYSDFVLGTADIQKSEINIFPNPAKKKVFISSILSLQNADVKIYSISGKLVLKRNLKYNYISINNLSKGIYFMKINHGKTQIIRKIIKN
jgi:hypothetical protein